MTRLPIPARRLAALPLLLAALVLAVLPGCEDEQLVEPDDAERGTIFNSYVALGNSITAGFQSGGIYAETQRESYTNLLAAGMGTEFDLPLLHAPGCPPPLTQIFPTQERLGGPEAPPCALRSPDVPPAINNVAVPGAEVIDATSNLSPASNANPLTTFILGGRTQVEAALDANPTFASVWIGNNDVLGAALAGNTALITDGADFENRYTALLDSLEQADDLQGALLIGVPDVTKVPALSAGAAYLGVVRQTDVAPPNLEVANTCAPSNRGGVGDVTLVPFQHGATLLQVATTLNQQMGDRAPTITLDCDQDRTVRETIGAAFGGVSNIPPSISDAISGTANISLLAQGEIGQVVQAVQQFNAVIEAQADERGYAYLDPNPLFAANAAQIPPFPELIDIPNNDFSPDQPFGPLFSLDGVHPSAQTHQIVAQAAAAAINDTYDTNLTVEASSSGN